MARGVVLGIVAAAAPKRGEERSRVMKKVANLLVLLAFALLVTPCYAGKPATRVPSGVKVYDANNQFVGTLVNVEPLVGPVVYVPAIGKLLALSEVTGEVSDDFRLDHVRYELANCDETGKMYQTAWSPGWDADYFYIKKHLDSNAAMRFYISEPVQPEIWFLSVHAWGSPNCENVGLVSGPGYLLREVQLPLTFPLAVPLRLE